MKKDDRQAQQSAGKKTVKKEGWQNKQPKIDNKWEIVITWVALFLSIAGGTMLGIEVFGVWMETFQNDDIVSSMTQIGFISIITFLLYSCFVYLLARMGRLKYQQEEQEINNEKREKLYSNTAPNLATLIPSYKEDPHVIRKTLLSAALQDYPASRVVLLIDNSLEAASFEDEKLLDETRRLPGEVRKMMAAPAHLFLKEYNAYLQRSQSDAPLETKREFKRLASLNCKAAQYLAGWVKDFPVHNHEDKWFVENILRLPAKKHAVRSSRFLKVANEKSVRDKETYLENEYCRLSRLFHVDISSFERKRYTNLPHEANKIMNLNSYIGLMGCGYREEKHADELHLIPAHKYNADSYIPDAEFIITLDVGSVLLPDYALRLVSKMQKPGNERLAVVQTPQSTFPVAKKGLECIAAASIDIQNLMQQGFNCYNAAFWIGTNALIRKAALKDIVIVEDERGFDVKKFIRGRTVVEDTESMMGLMDRGWQLYNYPKRLAYSATSSDFGSLLAKRRGWVSGGLVNVAKLLRYLVRKDTPKRFGHGLMGIHYLSSLAAMSFGILFLLAFPIEDVLRSPWLALAMLPCLALYIRDLMQCGYRGYDMLNVLALNLTLLPANIGGAFKSIAQIITGKKPSFESPQKVAGRTATPAVYILMTYGLFAYCTLCTVNAVDSALWGSAAFAGINTLLLSYAIIRFIGIKNSIQDLMLTLRKPPLQEIEPKIEDSPHVQAPPLFHELEKQAG